MKSEWNAVNAVGTAPSARHSHTANLTKDQAIVFGGTDGSQFFNDVHVYHFPTATWSQPTTKGSGPSPRANHAATVVGYKLYVFGGNDAGGIQSNGYILDLESWEWSEVTGLPAGRTTAVAVSIGPKISII